MIWEITTIVAAAAGLLFGQYVATRLFREPDHHWRLVNHITGSGWSVRIEPLTPGGKASVMISRGPVSTVEVFTAANHHVALSQALEFITKKELTGS